MTAMIGSADCPPARLAATRDGLHRVAEHLLAVARYAASGEIGLVPAPGGFRTPPFGPDGRFLAVDGTELVVGDAAAVLWPEHFDVGITAGAINYGASPGDDHIADPYLYVGPHDGRPPGDPAFWNAPFGAARTFRQIGTVAEAAAFFRDGRARALAAAAATPIRRTS
jgi:hypothetical protein